MNDYQPLTVLPEDIQRDWRASLQPAKPTTGGAFRLVAARRTHPQSFEAQRVTVLVVDENSFPMPNVKVAFSYSTAKYFLLPGNFQWYPPQPHRAFIVPTEGGGQIDQIQGDAVKENEAGGVAVYIFEPEYASDVVFGAGMLADHTGLHLIFQLRRTGVKSLAQQVADIETRLSRLEQELVS